MCLILVAWQAHQEFPLLVAANRDEFFSRPTAPAAFWPDGNILAGKDLQAGGTWLGITRNGRFAALTNYRDPTLNRADRRSRGTWVADFLASSETPAVWLSARQGQAAECNPFNLLVSDGRQLSYFSSITGGITHLSPGVYGLSNHLLDTPWPKVIAARSALASALNTLPDDRALFGLLRDDTVYPDTTLPRTGVSMAWERLLSAAFVAGPGYGTRSSTIVKLSVGGTGLFDEQTWLANGSPGPRHRYRLAIAG